MQRPPPGSIMILDVKNIKDCVCVVVFRSRMKGQHNEIYDLSSRFCTSGTKILDEQVILFGQLLSVEGLTVPETANGEDKSSFHSVALSSS